MDELLQSAEAYGKSPYGLHLRTVADGKLKYIKLKRLNCTLDTA